MRARSVTVWLAGVIRAVRLAVRGFAVRSWVHGFAVCGSWVRCSWVRRSWVRCSWARGFAVRGFVVRGFNDLQLTISPVVQRSQFSGFAISLSLSVCAWVLFLSLSLFARLRKWFEAKIWAENHFRWFWLILRSNWKYFQFDPIYHPNQTCYFPKNDFRILISVKTNGP